MSTRLTISGMPMVASQSLQLVKSASLVHDVMTNYLSHQLLAKGYEHATPSALMFLGTLECADNYASQIARNLGVSRQMVAKFVKSMCSAGYLEQLEGIGKQKRIVFTALGEQLMSEARICLSDFDHLLQKSLGAERLDKTLENLKEIHQVMASLSGE